jgi:hypothetical protein
MRVGDYEAFEEIDRSATATVWKGRNAREDGGDGVERAAKVLRPAVFWEEEETARRAREFLDRATVQERVAASAGPAAHWAPIHQKGGDQAGAFYVTDEYPLTVHELTRKKGDWLSGPELYGLIDGVVTGLEELKTAAGRAHGRLKPTNVLLASLAPDADAVRLSDPATDRDARDVGEAGDCFAVGQLIFALVMKRLPEEHEGPPAKLGAAWRALSRRAKRWRDLCARLLNHGGDQIATLEDLRRELARCKPETVSTRRLMTMAAVAVLLVAGGAALAFHFVTQGFNPANWKTLCVKSDEWFADFVTSVRNIPNSDPNWDTLIQSNDPDFWRIVQQIRNNPMTPAEIAHANTGDMANNPPRSAKTAQAVAQTQTALGVIRTLEQQLLEQWAARYRAAAMPERFKNIKGGVPGKIASAAKTFDDLKNNKAGHGADLPKAMADLVKGKQWLDPLVDLDRCATVFESMPRAGDDAVLKDFGAAAVRQVDTFSYRDENYTKVRELADAAKEVIQRMNSPTLAWEEFQKDPWREKAPPRGKDGLDDRLKTWLEVAQAYEQLPPAEDPRLPNSAVVAENWAVPEDPAKPLPKVGFAELLSGVEKEEEAARANYAEEADAPLKELAQFKGIYDKLKDPGKKWLAKDKQQLTAQVSELLREGTKARRKVWELAQSDNEETKRKFEQQWAEVNKVGQVDSPMIDAVWVRQRNEVIQAKFGTAKFKSKKLDSIKESLALLDRAFAARLDVPEATGRKWMTALQTAADARRDAALAKILPSFQWDSASSSPSTTFVSARQAAENDRSDWLALAQTSAKACVEMEDALNGYYLPGEPPAQGKRSIKDAVDEISKVKEADITTALAGPVGRAQKLVDFVTAAQKDPSRVRSVLEGALPKDPAGQVADEKLDEYVAAVRLADQRLPPDTSHVALVNAKAELEKRTTRAAPATLSKPRLDSLNKALEDHWWTVLVNQLNAPPEQYAERIFKGAVDLETKGAESGANKANVMDVAELQKRGLDDHGRFNLYAYKLIATLKSENREEKDKNTKPLFDELERIGNRLKGDLPPAVSDALKVMKEQKEDRGKPLNQVGPGTKGWMVDNDESARTGRAVFKRAASLQDGKVHTVGLRFADVPGTQSWLCTSEASVELLALVVAENQTLRDAFIKHAPKVGTEPCTWEMDQDRVIPWHENWLTIKPGRTKVAFNKRPNDAEKPDWGHPANLIPPTLARDFAESLGCYLPTVQEWQAALRDVEHGADAHAWNLRDADTWSVPTQDAQFLRDRLTGYTDNTARFAPWGRDGAGKFAPSGSYNDGYVWFAPVEVRGGNPGPGGVFTHLIGNVAEWVWWDADSRNDTSRSSSDTVKLDIIGGSALSSAGAPLSEPSLKREVRAVAKYTDVGFRLAMPRPGPPLWERLAKGGLPVLKPYFVKAGE